MILSWVAWIARKFVLILSSNMSSYKIGSWSGAAVIKSKDSSSHISKRLSCLNNVFFPQQTSHFLPRVICYVWLASILLPSISNGMLTNIPLSLSNPWASWEDDFNPSFRGGACSPVGIAYTPRVQGVKLVQSNWNLLPLAAWGEKDLLFPSKLRIRSPQKLYSHSWSVKGEAY